ncbi:16873_t:CDS:2 [Funneliformis caledonium]|uniref:16873_t:CDS:1 n=1 Tax=Funneliformis caledonium TaxID=1117310 RepID=A0A9N9CDM9_9GLOM|nr:16873_t:CDS:2 [Funneliformis caledonium]
MNKMNAFILLLLLQAFMISAQQLKFKLHTVRLPPAVAWFKCAESPQMIIGYGFYAQVTDLTTYIVQSECGEIGPGTAVVCKRQFPIIKSGMWCLAIFNPFLNAQKVNIVVSFTQSVFVEGTYRVDPNLNNTPVPNNLSFIEASYNNKKRNLGRNKTLRLDNSH